MKPQEVIDRCTSHPYGTEFNEYDNETLCYHWNLDVMIPEAELLEDYGEDMLWTVDGQLMKWVNNLRNYELLED